MPKRKKSDKPQQGSSSIEMTESNTIDNLPTKSLSPKKKGKKLTAILEKLLASAKDSAKPENVVEVPEKKTSNCSIKMESSILKSLLISTPVNITESFKRNEFSDLNLSITTQESSDGNSNIKSPGKKKYVRLPYDLKEFVFKCNMRHCVCRFKTEANAEYHRKCHNIEEKNYICPECKHKSERWERLKRHLWLRHKLDIEMFTCDVCGYKTEYMMKLKTHKEGHANDKLYTCTICKEVFRQVQQLVAHGTVHKGEKFKCDICGSAFNKIQTLHSHKQKMHESETYKCDLCDHSTKSRFFFQVHLRRHAGINPFQCDRCEFSASTNRMFLQHKKTHLKEKYYKCPYCSSLSHQVDSYVMHLQRRHPREEVTFLCAKCSFSSQNECEFQKHVEEHELGQIPTLSEHEKPAKQHKCDFCDYTAEMRYYVTKHMQRRHSGDKPFQCDRCGFCTNTKVVLIEHELVHSGEKPYQCEQCDFRTARRSSLRRHRMTHADDKPFQCPYCSYTCIERVNYKKHVRIKHPGQDDAFACELCSFTTLRKKNLENHLETHEGIMDLNLPTNDIPPGMVKTEVLELEDTDHCSTDEMYNSNEIFALNLIKKNTSLGSSVDSMSSDVSDSDNFSETAQDSLYSDEESNFIKDDKTKSDDSDKTRSDDSNKSGKSDDSSKSDTFHEYQNFKMQN